jgi:predicted Zn-dependent peptidase
VQEQPLELRRLTLDNGLSVWHQPRPDSKSVAVFLMAHVGERNENTSNNGITHYLEHMLFTGTEKWDEHEISEAIDKRGGYSGSWSSIEYTAYFAEIASQDFDIAMEWISQVVFHATLPEDKVEKERNVVFQEKWGKYGWIINTGHSLMERFGFGWNLWRTVEQFAYPNSSLAQRFFWEDDGLAGIDRDALLTYYRTYYVPGNTTLLIMGNVTPEQISAATQRYFADIPEGVVPARPKTPTEPQAGPYHAVIRGPVSTNQVRIRMGARTVGKAHPDRWALDVLGEMLDTSLSQEIRHKRGLVSHLWAYNIAYSDAGRFEIGTRSEGGKQEEIRQIIESHLDAIRRGDIDPEKLADAKTTLKGRWALNMENNFERFFWLNDWPMSLTSEEPVPDCIAEVDAVTPEDLTRVLDTYFTPERSYTVMHVPILTVYRGAWLGGGFLGFAAIGLIIYQKSRKKITGITPAQPMINIGISLSKERG